MSFNQRAMRESRNLQAFFFQLQKIWRERNDFVDDVDELNNYDGKINNTI